jgi:hypothetical protein
LKAGELASSRGQQGRTSQHGWLEEKKKKKKKLNKAHDGWERARLSPWPRPVRLGLALASRLGREGWGLGGALGPRPWLKGGFS